MSGPPPGNTIPTVCKPVIVELDGVFGELQSGSIINAGGISGNTFTVGGQALLFASGQPTDGSSGTGITLQTTYNNSPIVGGQAGITLAVGKDFVINDQNNGNYLTVSSTDGTVTINGDLIVNGTETIINTVIIQSDHQLIAPSSGTTTALIIQPKVGVTPLVDLVSWRVSYSAPPCFRVDSGGNLILTQNLTVGGLINGVNIVTLNTEVQAHLTGTVAGPVDAYQHEANAILITPITQIPGATNVQEALGYLAAEAGGGGGTVTSVGITSGTLHLSGTNPITTSGTIDIELPPTGVVNGTYSNPTLTIDQYGRVTSASNGSAGGVTSFNSRTGGVVLTDADVVTALNYTPQPINPTLTDLGSVGAGSETGAIVQTGVNTFSVLQNPAFGFEFTQATPSDSWAINHNGNTLRATITIYDTDMNQVFPNAVQVIDPNNVLVSFAAPQAGIALVILF